VLMRVFFRIVIIMISLCLVALLAYLGWLVLKHYWPEVLLGTFILIGIGVGFADVIIGPRIFRQTSQGFLLGLMSDASTSLSRRIFNRVVFFCIVSTGSWIYAVANGIKANVKSRYSGSTVRMAVDVVLKGIIVKWSILLLGLTLLGYVLIHLSPSAIFTGKYILEYFS
jgi:hypothetical protein